MSETSPGPPDQPVGVHDVAESWPVAGSTDVHRDAWVVALRKDEVLRPGSGGRPFTRLVFEHPGAVMILAVDEQERALVLHQYRHAARTRFAELPAGLRDTPGEDPLTTAQRELLEEGGVTAEHWKHLLATYPSPGFSSERVEIYLATGLRPAGGPVGFEAEHEEADMTMSWVPLTELHRAVLSGDVTDGCTQLAVLAHVAGDGRRPPPTP